MLRLHLWCLRAGHPFTHELRKNISNVMDADVLGLEERGRPPDSLETYDSLLASAVNICTIYWFLKAVIRSVSLGLSKLYIISIRRHASSSTGLLDFPTVFDITEYPVRALMPKYGDTSRFSIYNFVDVF